MSDDNNYPSGDEQLKNQPPAEQNEPSGNNDQADRYNQSNDPGQQPQGNQQSYDHYQQPQGYQQSFDHYQQSGNYQQTQNNYRTEEPNGMATASLVLGIISIVCSCCCCAAVPLAGLSIILAILSKGGAPRMSDRAKTGLGISIAALCITVILTAVSLFLNRSIFSSDEFRDQFRYYMDNYEGDYNYYPDEYDRMTDDFF